MQIVYIGDNLHKSQNLFSEGNKKTVINLSSAVLAQRMVKVKSGLYYSVDVSNKPY